MPKLRNVLILSAGGFGAAVTLLAAPLASAEPSLVPQCVNEGGSAAYGGSSTECATEGNVQINDSPAVYPGEDVDSYWGFPGFFM